MHRVVTTALLVIVFSASATQVMAHAPEHESATSPVVAEAPLTMAAQRLLPHWNTHRLLLLGEIHGTQETPALAAALLRAQQGTTPVLLGLEVPHQEQGAIDEFLQSDGSTDARRTLVAGAFWQRDMQDGRSSTAMLALLDSVRTLRADGALITVVCFDDTQPPADGLDRDARMAKALRTALDADAKRPALVLTGNYHARTVRGAPWNPRQEFMGWHLRDLDPLSIDVTAPTGTYWACASFCEINTFGASRPPGTLALTVAEQVDANGYRGTLTLPIFSASVPAKR